ncbi:hypothetical protein N7532_012129 [Penicillium argentinense]|uniref:N-acetyltransferase domain-containing protein n=1 Tax=Penicillium argentinense TaxID=1131581 RepID=A0A9W9JVN6_9EURO|nr:uncharacterized protein N7532_012129 [Penicillium argentinense]KAJ5083086.1 hypothetical protein N7532_012129 [Penicillium argentinense]
MAHLRRQAEAALDLLMSRGYTDRGTLVTYWCALQASSVQPDQTGPQQHHMPGVTVRPAQPHEMRQFVAASIAGFSSNGRSRELLGVLAEIATRRPDTTLYVAQVGEEIARTAAMASMEGAVDEGLGFGVAHLYLDSTVPAHRGKDIQTALIRARLAEAQRRGLGLVTSITRVGDGSARNVERAGLRPAYTMRILTGSSCL